MDSHKLFYIPSDFGIMTWENNSYAENEWKNREGVAQALEIKNLQSINGVLRNTEMINVNPETKIYRSYESGFIDLLNAHNVYLHCPNLGHFNSIGVRGESTIIQKCRCLPHPVI